MTKPRRKPANHFHAFIVEPEPGFEPTNWRQKPAHYRILSYVGPKYFRGTADAWKFLHNHNAMSNGDTTKWALFLDFEQPCCDGKEIVNERVTAPANFGSIRLAEFC